MSKSVRVVYVDPVSREISLQFPLIPQYITGIDLLIQVVALAYLTNPGQDINSPDDGSGVREIIGQIDVVGEEQLKADFLTRTAKIEGEIIANQSTLDLPASERLRSLTIQGMAVDAVNLELKARVKIENQAGQSRVVGV